MTLNHAVSHLLDYGVGNGRNCHCQPFLGTISIKLCVQNLKQHYVPLWLHANTNVERKFLKKMFCLALFSTVKPRARIVVESTYSEMFVSVSAIYILLL